MLIFRTFLCGLVSLSLAARAGAQTTASSVCFTSSGKITVRSSCLTGETRAALLHLAPKGVTGDTGAVGAKGAPGRQLKSTYRGNVNVSQEGLVFTEACPSGKIPVGGGCSSTHGSVAIHSSYPTYGVTKGWVCKFYPRDGSGPLASGLYTYAICVTGD